MPDQNIPNQKSPTWISNQHLIPIRLQKYVNGSINIVFIVPETGIKEGELGEIEGCQSPHNALMNVGELDQLPIYIATNSNAFESQDTVGLVPPSTADLRTMYQGFKETFNRYSDFCRLLLCSYSERFILYYLYEIKPIKEKMTFESLIEMLSGMSINVNWFLIDGQDLQNTTKTDHLEPLEDSKIDQTDLSDTVKNSSCKLFPALNLP